jgi:alpha-beta hydrolase superfamily lysophospholipase
MRKQKTLIIFFFAIITNFIKAQEVYTYEKQISNLQNYISTEIDTENLEDKVVLKGTLIEPKSNYTTVVIIVPGSGIDTRNSHYRLTEKLLENNIAVYRYDERGCGLSTGKFNTISYTINDMINDLKFVYLNIKNQKTVVGKKIGLLGHSLGGMTTIGILDKNMTPDFLVQWATPIQKKGEFIKYQLTTGVNKFEEELVYNSIEEKFFVIDKINTVIFENKNDENLVLCKKIDKVSKDIEYKKKNYKRFTYANFSSTKELIKKDFENTYKNCKIKLLYIIGENDKFVDAKKETELLESFNNPNIEIKKIGNLNHYLKNGIENIKEKYEIEDNGVNEITNWIKNQ